MLRSKNESTPAHVRLLVPTWLQIVAWGMGLAACLLGMLEWIAEWQSPVATLELLALAIAPIIFMWPTRRRASDESGRAVQTANRADFLISLLLGGLSFGICFSAGHELENQPPAYHDEFSYLFQAQTLLRGRLTFPSHPTHPELFDQMHVLNEGRMASRYYPGTGLWLAPFVALRIPYWASWTAAAVSTVLIYWIGRELGTRLTAIIAALSAALSPGICLFSNTLLSHPASMVSLMVFLLGAVRWERTRGTRDSIMAGTGLSLAMLCRPMTAAAIGLPFGVDVLWWLLGKTCPSGQVIGKKEWRGTLLGYGVPLLLGWSLMLTYNHAVTSDWLMSPYQLYTNIYTPRHVYGFNNVIRGEQRLGPKVLDAYDRRWAENLTPELAARNELVRWLASWIWTFDILPLLICSTIFLGMWRVQDRCWKLIFLAIVSLHIVHVPYWYVGIMGWHYVFESAPLWCLIVGLVTTELAGTWRAQGKPGLTIWWLSLLLAIMLANHVSAAGFWKPRLQRGLNPLQHPRRVHAELRNWIEERVKRPALVLLEQPSEESHLDLVVNQPGLSSDILMGRFREGQTDVHQVRRDFPDRHVYVANPEQRSIREIE